MRPQDRATARRQLDKRLSLLQNAEMFACPPQGWLKAIREALGMTTAQFGKRLGVSQPRAVNIEKGEAKGSIKLDSLEKAAHALDCRLVYAIVPRAPLESLVEERASLLATKRMKSTAHTMKLEAQGVSAADESEQLRQLTRQLIQKAGPKLWDDE